MSLKDKRRETGPSGSIKSLESIVMFLLRLFSVVDYATLSIH